MTASEDSKFKINEVVKGMLFDKHLTIGDLSEALGWSYDSGYKLIKRTDWKISEMQAAGRLLQFNFFSLFVDTTHVGGLQNALKEKETELEKQNQKVILLEMENKYLKELVEMARLKLKK
jgi:hypothetical protein